LHFPKLLKITRIGILGVKDKLYPAHRLDNYYFLEAGQAGLGDPCRAGIVVEHFENPASGDILGQGGQFREDARQEVVEAIDGLRGLFDLGLEASGHFA
jgi:hypothetical protein